MKYTLFGAGIILLDQISKWMIRRVLPVGMSVPVLGEFFQLTYVQNRGAAFSMLSGERAILMILPAVVVVGAIIYFLKHTGKHWLFYTSWSMIIAGGIGNLIDRAVFGWVTDMLDFSIFPPVFNIADIGVTVG
ncbi:MAG: signal peptidase II, partial [Spirochaetaceae bacterium]|nr:signal peptidase II [Spirochaetaceae bacterium]